MLVAVNSILPAVLTNKLDAVKVDRTALPDSSQCEKLFLGGCSSVSQSGRFCSLRGDTSQPEGGGGRAFAKMRY